MGRQSKEFALFVRQVARRCRDLLKDDQRRLILPPLGQAWTPTDREQSLSEAFVVFFAAELETYLEYVVSTSMTMYLDSLLSSGLAECGGATAYVSALQERLKRWEKNNNTSWKKIGEFWEFVGLNKSKFPNDVWDDIDAVTVDRGDIAHNSFGLRVIKDPRLTMRSVAAILRKLRLFDRDFKLWLTLRTAELQRFRSAPLVFVPGLGSISPL